LVKSALAGIDTVFHLAAQSNVLGAVSDPDNCFSSNVIGTFNVLYEAQQARVQRVIFTSSREVYGDVQSLPVSESFPLLPKNTYGTSKLAGELYTKAFPGLDVTTLRLSNVYGPGDQGRVVPLFLDAALSGEDLLIYGEDKILDFVWIDDVVDALVAAANLPVAGRAINIGSGLASDLVGLAQQVIKATHSRSSLRQTPARSVEVDRYVADITLARDLLLYRPNPVPLHGIGEIALTALASRTSHAARRAASDVKRPTVEVNLSTRLSTEWPTSATPAPGRNRLRQ